MKYLILLALLFSCAGTRLTDEGITVSTMRPSYATRCQKLGTVVGKGHDLKNTQNDARNKAAKLGANYLDMDIPRIDVVNFRAAGIAYRCR